MTEKHVRILLPVYNDFEKVKRTLGSIKEQTYNIDKIEVIAAIFSEIDEDLYCYLLDYPLPHIAVYRMNKLEREIDEYAEINEVSDESLRLHVAYSLELQMGDSLFPDMIEKCVHILESDLRIRGVICESDIRQKNGEILHQTPLYETSCLLGYENRLDPLTFGYFHRVLYFARYKKRGNAQGIRGWLKYDVHFWNYNFFKGASNRIAYLKEIEAIIDGDVKKWDCSFKKILSVYTAVLQFVRLYEYSEMDRIEYKMQEDIWKNYAYMSLAMSCELASQERYSEAKDCFLFSKVIWLPISEEQFYRSVKEQLSQNDKVTWERMIKKIVESGGRYIE